MPNETLIRDDDCVLTMDEAQHELARADVLINDGVIARVDYGLINGRTVVSARGCVVTPGLVNTHHHLFQTPVPKSPLISTHAPDHQGLSR